MALHNPNPNPNAFVRFMRKIYHPLGFKKGYNFILWFIFSGALFGFFLARLQYLSINGLYKAQAGPGEWYFYSRKFYHTGITLHLSTVIPASGLAILQFTPIIRHKALIFHRVNGYLTILLLLLGNAGALMIARHAFGGTLSTQACVGTLAIATTTSLFLAYYNIKRLQIDQHRAWMLRAWFYAGTIITLRLIQILAALIISRIGTYHIATSCAQIAYTSGEAVAKSYVGCSASNSQGWTVVDANITDPKNAMEAAAALQLTFGMAAWLALALHAIGVEVYLALTPAEGERLRGVSYERQLERGFRFPGSAGLTADRIGDAEPWRPVGDEGESKVGGL